MSNAITLEHIREQNRIRQNRHYKAHHLEVNAKKREKTAELKRLKVKNEALKKTAPAPAPTPEPAPEPQPQPEDPNKIK